MSDTQANPTLDWDDEASVAAFVEWEAQVTTELRVRFDLTDLSNVDHAAFVDDYEAGLTPTESAAGTVAELEVEDDE